MNSRLTDAPVTANPHPPHDGEDTAGRAGGFSGMVWLTWRQHRWAILGTLVLATVLVVWMAYLSAELTDFYHQCHNTACPPNSPQGLRLSGSSALTWSLNDLGLAVQYAPLLVGVFIGVPLLAREHEQRTLPLAWSQDVSAVRWLWTKLGLLGLFVAAVTGVVSIVADHLTHVYADLTNGGLFQGTSFFVTGLLPLASAVCWFAVGVALGAVLRRTLPAMFGVVAGYVGVMLGLQWRYPTLMTPLAGFRHFDQPGLSAADPNVLIVKGQTFLGPGAPSNLFDSSGHQLSFEELRRMCPDIVVDPDTGFACFVRNHVQTYVTYQPSSRIPAFHLIIAGGYLGLAAVAIATVWLIVRRTSVSAG